jgi:hypothetical protein
VRSIGSLASTGVAVSAASTVPAPPPPAAATHPSRPAGRRRMAAALTEATTRAPVVCASMHPRCIRRAVVQRLPPGPHALRRGQLGGRGPATRDRLGVGCGVQRTASGVPIPSRAGLAGCDTAETGRRLARAAAAVEQLLPDAAPGTSAPLLVTEVPVTKSVTETRTEPATREPSTPPRASGTVRHPGANPSLLARSGQSRNQSRKSNGRPHALLHQVSDGQLATQPVVDRHRCLRRDDGAACAHHAGDPPAPHAGELRLDVAHRRGDDPADPLLLEQVQVAALALARPGVVRNQQVHLASGHALFDRRRDLRRGGAGQLERDEADDRADPAPQGARGVVGVRSRERRSRRGSARASRRRADRACGSSSTPTRARPARAPPPDGSSPCSG